MDKIAARLREIVNETKPAVVVTWGQEGVMGHPDHRTTNSIVTQVFQQRALLAHKPRKLYYLVFPESRFAKAAPGGRRRPFLTPSDAFITTGIECGAALDAAARSVTCHKTQWNAERMKDMDQMNRVTLGGRVFLRLALSDVPLPAGKRERDLFEGIAQR